MGDVEDARGPSRIFVLDGFFRGRTDVLRELSERGHAGLEGAILPAFGRPVFQSHVHAFNQHSRIGPSVPGQKRDSIPTMCLAAIRSVATCEWISE